MKRISTRTFPWNLQQLSTCLQRKLGLRSFSTGPTPRFQTSATASDADSTPGSDSSDSPNQNQGQSTVLKNEVDKFERMSGNWWSSSGEFKALHSMNRLRIPFIRDGFLNNAQISDSSIEFPLTGLKVLDVGCGGGILTMPLGRLGAQVTGIDAGKENIAIANSELERFSSFGNSQFPQLEERVRFICCPLEDFIVEHLEDFDGVVVSEVLEHVADARYFLQLAAEAVKPGGSLFLTTINRTYLSWLGAIVAAEWMLRLLPVGTHAWKQFVPPEEVTAALNRTGMATRLVHGMAYNPWTDSWSWTRCTDVNYALQAVKLG